jgi:hypothetical protein
MLSPMALNPTGRRLELVATVLLSLATLGTAWSAYQSRQWTGEQATGYSKGTAARIYANRASGLANRNAQIDVATFIQWLDANAHRDAKLASFYRTRFRPEFKPAFAAWIATNPLQNKAAPPSPFAMPQYRLKATTQADAFEATAAVQSEKAKKANERANNYMLAVVLFGSCLFFAGISTKMQTPRYQTVLVGIGCILFLAAAIWLATSPVRLTT